MSDTTIRTETMHRVGGSMQVVSLADHQAAIASKDREIDRLQARLNRVWDEVLNQGREYAFQCSPDMQKIEDAFNEPPGSEAKP